ncbi:MAG: hypothetical protein KBT36_17370 [Kurthia sp.]|nr:hypothetical protein [Candidatus Kurthia equi]
MKIRIIDFAWHGAQTLFVEITIESTQGTIKGMVRILDGIIYGDLVHPQKSMLSVEEIEDVKGYLTEKFNSGFFE